MIAVSQQMLNKQFYFVNRCNFPLSDLMPSEAYEDYVKRCSASIKQIIDSCITEGNL